MILKKVNFKYLLNFMFATFVLFQLHDNKVINVQMYTILAPQKILRFRVKSGQLF